MFFFHWTKESKPKLLLCNQEYQIDLSFFWLLFLYRKKYEDVILYSWVWSNSIKSCQIRLESLRKIRVQSSINCQDFTWISLRGSGPLKLQTWEICPLFGLFLERKMWLPLLLWPRSWFYWDWISLVTGLISTKNLSFQNKGPIYPSVSCFKIGKIEF